MRRTSSTLTAILAMTLLAACGGGGGTTQPNPPPGGGPPPGPPSASASVEMKSDPDGYGGTTNTFVPNSVRLARNGTVTWSNPTGVMHNVTFDATTGAPQDVAGYTSGTITRTFGTVGTFGYRCTLHIGMTGTVSVE